jgi:hypothetical protein
MAVTYQKIASTVLTTTASTITFSSIPTTYTDIVVSAGGLTTRINDVLVRFNSDSGTNYGRNYLVGNGTGVEVSRSNSTAYINAGYFPTASTGFGYNMHINSYANTTTFKNILLQYATVGNWSGMITGLWRNTSAINTIDFIAQSNTFNAGTTFTLYGIKAGS